MYGERLIPKLKYGIHDNIKPVPTGPDSRVFESTPSQPENSPKAGTYRRTVKY